MRLRRKRASEAETALPGMPAISAHLTADKYLGLVPLEASDAIGVRYKGRVYHWTGNRGRDVDADGRPCVKARARNADGDEIDVVQWLIPTGAQARLYPPLDVHLVYPPVANQAPLFDSGVGWEAFR